MPIAVGGEVHLSLRHSVYGSQVEEHFRLSREGLQLVRLRYAELRLVEFFGHEVARRDGDWWVVEGDRPNIPILTLRVSPESRMRLAVGRETISLWEQVEPGGWVRLGVVACVEGPHAR